MTSLNRQDGDLHDENGEHRTTPPTTSGRALASHERRIRLHLEAHARQAYIEAMLDDVVGPA